MDEKSLQRVKDLRDKGLTFKQVAKEMKLSESAVKRAIVKLKKIEAEKAQAAQEDRLRVLIREELEAAKNSQNNAGNGLPVVRKWGQGMEVINPEAVLRSYLLQDGEPGQWMLKGMMLIRAAQLMVMDDVAVMKGEAEAHAKLMEPILKLMKETREEQDAAAERARASSLEIAEAAAHQAASHVAGQLTPEIQALKVQMAAGSAPDPFTRMMNFLQGLPQLVSAGQELMRGLGMALPGQPQGAPSGSGQPEPGWSPHPIERHPLSELEEKDVG